MTVGGERNDSAGRAEHCRHASDESLLPRPNEIEMEGDRTRDLCREPSGRPEDG